MLYNKKRSNSLCHDKNSSHQAVQVECCQLSQRVPDLTPVECAKNLGIGVSTLARWEAQFRDNDDDIPVIGSGSYASEEAKEIAHLKRELRDTQDALDVLKKPSAFWEKINKSYLY